jgi:hypothetical protein
VTVKGFRKCCISNAMDGTDDDDDKSCIGSEKDGNIMTVRKTKALTEDGESNTNW